MFDKFGNYVPPKASQDVDETIKSAYIRPSKVSKANVIDAKRKEKYAKVPLKKFDFKKQMKPLSNFLVIGKRNTGKTNLLKALLYYLCRGGMKGIGKIAVLSGSELENPQYKDMFGIPIEFIRPEADVGFVERIMDMQRNITSSIREETGQKTVKDMQHAMIVIIDDLIYDPKFMKSEIINQIMVKGRHSLTGIVILTQQTLGTKAGSRTNYDYVFTFRLPSKREIKNCYENFFPGFSSELEFKNTMHFYTQNYGFIVADNTVMGGEIDEQYFYGRFPNLDEFQVMFKLNYADTAPYLKFLSGLSDEEYQSRYGFTNMCLTGKNGIETETETRQEQHDLTQIQRSNRGNVAEEEEEDNEKHAIQRTMVNNNDKDDEDEDDDDEDDDDEDDEDDDDEDDGNDDD